MFWGPRPFLYAAEAAVVGAAVGGMYAAGSNRQPYETIYVQVSYVWGHGWEGFTILRSRQVMRTVTVSRCDISKLAYGIGDL